MDVAGSFSHFYCSLFLVLTLQGATVSQDDTCATSFVERATVGQQLQIHCRTECSGQQSEVEWGQLNSDEPVNSRGRDFIVQNILNDSIGGRVYWCQCSDSNRECHLVLVNPYIFDFVAEPIVVAAGQRFNLTCRAGGYPRPEQADFHLAKYVPVSSIDISNVVTVPVQSGVLATYHDISVEYSGNYTCVVNTNYVNGGTSINMHTSVSRAKVTVYDPPKLRDIRNFSAISEDIEQSAVLECIIEETLSASVVLEWRRNGTLLQNSPKYVLPAPLPADTSNQFVYMLVVRELAVSDMGAYECWLYSNYSFLQRSLEDVLPVWILKSGETCTTSAPTTEGIKECNCSNSLYVVAAVLGVVALFILAAVVALIYFGYTHRNQCTRSRGVSHSSDSSEGTRNDTRSDLQLEDRNNGQQQSLAPDYGDDSESDEVDPEASISLLSVSGVQNQGAPVQNIARPQENLQAGGAEQRGQRRVSFQLSEPAANIRRWSRSSAPGDEAVEVLLNEQASTSEEHII